MDTEQSYGIIPLRKTNGEWESLLIRHLSGTHWAFPKGHAEAGEKPMVAANRELFEETGLTVVKFLSEQVLEESYEFYSRGNKIFKTVYYFLAEVQGDVLLQKSEIAASKWVLLSEASHHVTFPEAKSLCKKAIALL